jgi:indole-3-acetate monooxygenase
MPCSRQVCIAIQLATAHAIAGAAQAVGVVHAVAGTSAIRNAYKFQQYFREVHTITQRAFASASRYESVGAGILGVESEGGSFAL